MSSFLFEGNDSKVEGLANFEKLRMIAKEIRHVVRMTSVNMDPAVMFRNRSVIVKKPNKDIFFCISMAGALQILKFGWGSLLKTYSILEIVACDHVQFQRLKCLQLNAMQNKILQSNILYLIFAFI